jgi:prevent-host-death family protein
MSEPVAQTMKASEAHKQWSQLINKVFQGESRIIIEKSGIPVVAIISATDLERLTQLEAKHKERFKPLEETWKAFKDVPPEEIEREVARAIAEVRQKRRHER